MRTVPKDVIIKVKQRDNLRCLKCSNPGTDVHHIVPRSQFGKKDINRDAIWNLCLLCRSCHSEAHTKGSRIELLGIMTLRYNYVYDMYPWQKYI